MLKVKNITKSYANGKVNAVQNVSFDVKPGEIFGFLGPNGAGKSTTIKMLTGILRFTEGDIEVCGKSIKTDRIGAQNEIGYVPDNHAVYDKLSGLEYVNFIADVYGVPAEVRKELIQKFAKMFNLENDLNKQIKSYSHGMKQKITVMGALVHSPKLWVLDEPMTGLDPQSSYELKNYMREHCNQGNSVFFSSHVLEVVEKVCDRIAIINKGQIIDVGTVDEITKKAGCSLEEYFIKITANDSNNQQNSNQQNSNQQNSNQVSTENNSENNQENTENKN